MHDLTVFELPDLIDMLSGHTAHYLKMLSDGATKEEFDQCREIIIDLQTEIRLRKNQERINSATSKNISIKADHYPVEREKKSG